MKKFLAAMPLAILLAFSSASLAKDFPWCGAQIQTAIGGSIPLVGEKLSIRASGAVFWVPENQVIMFFAYSGPVWSPAEWIWISPQLGYAANWMPDGEDAVDVSLWIGLSFFKGQLTLFLESEAIMNADQQDYYGFYSVDYNPLEYLNIGIQVEAINKLAMFGPHIGFTHGFWHCEVQYYVGVQDENMGHAVRIFNSLNF